MDVEEGGFWYSKQKIIFFFFEKIAANLDIEYFTGIIHSHFYGRIFSQLSHKIVKFQYQNIFTTLSIKNFKIPGTSLKIMTKWFISKTDFGEKQLPNPKIAHINRCHIFLKLIFSASLLNRAHKLSLLVPIICKQIKAQKFTKK